MIDINELWIKVNDLTRKDQAGWSSTNEFNRHIELIQTIMFEFHYYHRRVKESEEALRPFISSQVTSRSGQIYLFPSDYKREIEFLIQTTTPGCSDPTYIPVETPAKGELGRTLTSGTRKPDINNEVYVAEQEFTGIRIYPLSYTGPLLYKYYKVPPVAVRGFTVNVSTQEEEYDAATTVNLEWDQDQLSSFVDLLLAMRGVTFRDSALLQWVYSRRELSNQLSEVS